MALSANALHNVQRYGLEADMVQKQTDAEIVKGQFYVGTDSGKLRLGISDTTYFEFAKAGDIPNVLVDDTPSVDLSKANDGTITAAVKRSANAGNAIQELTDGLFVEIPANYITSVADTDTSTITVDPTGTLNVDVKVSTDSENIIQVVNDGLSVVIPANYVNDVIDTNSVDLTNDNGTITAAVKRSANAGNAIQELTDGLFVEIPADFIQGVSNTNTVNLNVDGSDVITADLRIDPATDNLLTSSAAGVHAKKYTIHPDSSGLASINAQNQIKIEKLLVGEIYRYNAAGSTIASYVASAQFGTDNPQTNDKIVLENPASGGQEVWLCASASPASASDFILLEDPDVTETYIRTRLSASNGAQYNTSTGNFTASPSTVANNDLTLASDDKLYVRAATAPVSITKGNSSVSQTIEFTLNELMARYYHAQNGLTEDGLTFKLGGPLLEDTTIDGAFDLTIHTVKFDGTNLDVLTGDIKFNASTQGLLMKDSNGQYWKQTVTTAGQWNGVPFI